MNNTSSLPSPAISFNLDDESEVASFISTYGNTRGRTLANLLGFTGRGAASRANTLSNYAWNKSTAIGLRRSGDIATALQYERICDTLYSCMNAADRW